METLGIIVLVVVGFFLLRFVSKAKTLANTANEVMNTASKFKMVIQIVRQKAEHFIAPGAMNSEKETYIAYLYEIGVAMSVADNHPETMCQAFVMEETRAISDLPEEGDSKALMHRCLQTASGKEGSKMGKVDGKKQADRYSSPPYFVEFDKWLNQRASAKS